MGGRSLNDSDEEDEEEDGEQEVRIPPRNCAFYNTKLRKDGRLALLMLKTSVILYIYKKIYIIVCSFHRAMASATWFSQLQ